MSVRHIDHDHDPYRYPRPSDVDPLRPSQDTRSKSVAIAHFFALALAGALMGFGLWSALFHMMGIRFFWNYPYLLNITAILLPALTGLLAPIAHVARRAHPSRNTRSKSVAIAHFFALALAGALMGFGLWMAMFLIMGRPFLMNYPRFVGATQILLPTLMGVLLPIVHVARKNLRGQERSTR